MGEVKKAFEAAKMGGRWWSVVGREVDAGGEERRGRQVGVVVVDGVELVDVGQLQGVGPSSGAGGRGDGDGTSSLSLSGVKSFFELELESGEVELEGPGLGLSQVDLGAEMKMLKSAAEVVLASSRRC